MPKENLFYSEPITAELGNREELRQRLNTGNVTSVEFEALVFRAGPNRNHLRFYDADLPALAASFTGQPFLRNHDTEDIASRDGTVITSQLEGNAIRQRIQLTTQRGIRSYAEGQIDRFSIGWFFEDIRCSICGNSYFDHGCSHTRGTKYVVNNQVKTCELFFVNPTGKETSAVNVPAVEGTSVLAQLDARKANTMDPKEQTTEAQSAPQSSQEWLQIARQQTIDALIASSNLSATVIAAVRSALADAPNATVDEVKAIIEQQRDAERGRLNASAWVNTMRQQTVDNLITAARLTPSGAAAVRTALAAIPDATVDQVKALVDAQKKAQAELADSSAVHGLNPRLSGMRTAQEDVQNAFNWLMGDREAQTPPPSLRNIKDLYLDITGDWGFHGVFDREQARLAAATTTTLAGMTVNALNKVILQHYQAMLTYRWYEPIVSVLPHDASTLPVQMIMLDGIADLPSVNEGAAYTEAAVGDSKEQLSFVKRGTYVGITLEMFRRSDVGKMQAIPRALVNACLRTRSAAVANIFTQAAGVGPTLADDSKALFHADHGNLSADVFSYAAWQAARAECFNQPIPGTGGKKFGLWPSYVLLPIGLYDTALETFNYGSGIGGKPGTPNNDANPYGIDRPGDPRPMPIAVPEFTDANDWAYVADPSLHPTICMSYANAPGGNIHAAPEIFTASSETEGLLFTNDTLPVKIRDWFGVGVATYVGIGKRNVA